MMTYPSHGLSMKRNWGTVKKCPHCVKTNITMTCKDQITCGGITCRDLQNKKAARDRTAARKALRVAAQEAAWTLDCTSRIPHSICH
jgi:hypothetical protein